MKHNIINGLAACAVAMMAAAPLQPAVASPQTGTAAAEEAAHRVNLAGRQRMLSQRISKAACFVATGYDTQAQMAALEEAVPVFAETLDALQFGNTEMGFGAEEHPEILKALALAAGDWRDFSPLMDTALANGFVSLPALARIDETGLSLLGNMNKAVNRIANVYGELLPDMPLILSLTIDLAGRQRMFTQKAAKEFCLIGAGIDVETNRQNLAKTTQLFTLTLDALIGGMPGMVMAAPNAEIEGALQNIKAEWATPRALLETVAAGGEITEAEQAALIADIERVLVLMNEAVGMYEEAIPEPE